MRIAGLAAFSFILLTATAIGAGAQTATPSCHGAQQPKMVAELMFGRDIGDGVGVSEAEWQRFVARELVSRFPDGLTIIDAIADVAAEHQFGDHLGLLRAVARRRRGLRAGCRRSGETEDEGGKAGDAHRSNTSP